jgi:hypothetical protein
LLPWVAPSIFSMDCLKDAQVAATASRRRSAPPSGERHAGLPLAGGSPPRPASQPTPLHEARRRASWSQASGSPSQGPHAAQQRAGAFSRWECSSAASASVLLRVVSANFAQFWPWRAATAGPFSASGFSLPGASLALPLPSLHLPGQPIPHFSPSQHSIHSLSSHPLPSQHQYPKGRNATQFGRERGIDREPDSAVEEQRDPAVRTPDSAQPNHDGTLRSPSSCSGYLTYEYSSLPRTQEELGHVLTPTPLGRRPLRLPLILLLILSSAALWTPPLGCAAVPPPVVP